jgi:4-amino-4-deoxy-L-arabinose transferase-like glycosyltransferase
MESATHPRTRPWNSTRLRERLRAVPLPRPELAALLVLAAALYLWNLSLNGWANDYYSAAVRSMAGSWHDFLYGSFDAKGLMTVDKPPLALWVEALSAKVFGFNSLAILVPQALMGVASVGLLYDLTRRRFGRAAGAVAGLALAITPVFVAISRHNNPDAALILCTVGALWCFVRALDRASEAAVEAPGVAPRARGARTAAGHARTAKRAERGATKWLVAAGVCVGLGFEAKMGAALMVVPGMALAWLWVAPRGRLVAIRQLAIAGAALLAVALAWPLLVWLTPAASRPWISGTSDNSIWSLIWEYNGFGRLEGQTGGPGSLGTSGTFGGATGPFRLLNEALGGQAGWLLGAALAGTLGIALLSRLRRTDPRTGWIIALGGAFATTAVAFSFADGIFHPYYTSLLAPFAAALVGATVGQVLAAERGGTPLRSATDGDSAPTPDARGHEVILSRLVGAVAIGLGAVVELVVINNSASDLDWLVIPLVAVSVAALGALLFADPIAARLGGRSRGGTSTARRVRVAALSCAVAILLVGPAIWSVDTLGHPTSGTFPAGGPESASSMGGPGGGAPGGFGGGKSGGMGGPPSFGGTESGSTSTGGESSNSVGELFGESAESSGGGGVAPGGKTGGPPSSGGGMSAGGGGGGMFGGEDLSSVIAYTEAHGGGTIAVDSQSGASASIIEGGAEVAGIGGFSGKESSVSVEWLEERIEAGDISWIYTSGSGGSGAGFGGGGPGGAGGDTRTGSESAIDEVVESCMAISASEYESGESGSASESTGEGSTGQAGGSGAGGTLYKCGDS